MSSLAKRKGWVASERRPRVYLIPKPPTLDSFIVPWSPEGWVLTIPVPALNADIAWTAHAEELEAAEQFARGNADHAPLPIYYGPAEAPKGNP